MRKTRRESPPKGSIEPVLTDGLVRGDPKALEAVDRVVQERILNDSIARVKIWDQSRPHRLLGRATPDRRAISS